MAKKKTAAAPAKGMNQRRPARPKAMPRGINNPTLFSVQELTFVGPYYVLPKADGTGLDGNTQSVKVWVYTTLLPPFPIPVPNCAVTINLANGTWETSDLPSPQGNPTGTTPNTLVAWYFSGLNGTGTYQGMDQRYFFGKC